MATTHNEKKQYVKYNIDEVVENFTLITDWESNDS